MLDLRQKKGAVINNEDITVTANNTYTASEGYTGLGTVVVNVQPNNEDKTITANGTYTAAEGYTGLGTVDVNVPVPFIPELTGMKTLYTAKTTNSSNVITSVCYPSGTKANLVISPSKSSSTIGLSDVSGLVTDFAFPSTITQLKIEMGIVLNSVYSSSPDTAFIVGYGGNNPNDRYSVSIQATSSTRKLMVYFSENATSWVTMTNDTGYAISTGVLTNLSIEYKLNENSKIDVIVGASTGTDPLTQVFTTTTTASSIAKPKNDLMSFFYASSGGSGSYRNTAIATDINKLKITVNNEVKFNGANV